MTLDARGLRGLIAESPRILLTGPEDPDGDSIGACLALKLVIEAMGEHQVDVAGSPSFRYEWMPGASAMLADERVTGPYDLAIVLDGDRTRLSPPVTRAFAGAGARAIIDHHGTTSEEGYDLALIARDAESTCGMILDLMDAWGGALTADIASLLYAGIIFDTGGFRYSNTGSGTHRNAARLLDQGIDHASIAIRVLMERRRSGMLLTARVLDTAVFHAEGAIIQGMVPQAVVAELSSSKSDVEGIVDAMVYVQGVEVAVLIVERGPQTVKLSLRSRGRVDVAEVARSLHPSGGGHRRAAGVILDEGLDSALLRVPAALKQALSASAA